MTQKRLIARLDIKAPNLIKSVQLEGLRKIGNPAEYADKYYNEGIDEIIYMDVVASLYERNGLAEIVSSTTKNVFVPITVGGGIRSIEDIETMMHCGADKIALNTAAIKRPEVISEMANVFGSQCIVISIEAKQNSPHQWEPYTDNGREKTGLDVIDWARKATSLGAGEILLTSVDREGTRKGFDVELTKQVSSHVNTPVIASGGMGSVDHMIEVIKDTEVEAIAMADILHYDRMTLANIRQGMIDAGIPIRHLRS